MSDSRRPVAPHRNMDGICRPVEGYSDPELLILGALSHHSP